MASICTYVPFPSFPSSPLFSALSEPQYQAKKAVFIFAGAELLVPGSLAVLWPTSALWASLLGTHCFGSAGESYVLLVTDKAKAKVTGINETLLKVHPMYFLSYYNLQCIVQQLFLFTCIYAAVAYWVNNNLSYRKKKKIKKNLEQDS